jgi:CRP-like cAMP-binding protein
LSIMSRLPAIDPEHPDQAELIIRRLSQCAELGQDEVELLRSLSDTPERLAAGTELISEGERLENPRLLLAGWACRQRYLSDGRRQIFDFILPGDIYGLCLRPQAVALCNAVTLTRATISNATALGDAVLTHPEGYPGLTSATLMSASTDEAYLLNQMVRIGRQTAYERVAHLILELYHRLSIVGLANENFMPLPLTQEIIADALGLSIVHLNRTLQQLRRDGIVEVKGGVARIQDRSRLASIADFHAPRVSARRMENGGMRLHAASP